MTPFSSREENCEIVCCCISDSIALFKRLLRFWATFWNDTILARKKSVSLLLWFIRSCQKLCCSYQYYCTCKICLKKHKPRTFWQRDRYLWVLNAAVYLRDINTQFVWFYFARSLRTLSHFWRKRFSLKNIFTFAWTCTDRLRDWIILSDTFVFLTLHSQAELSIYTRTSFFMICKRNRLDFWEHWYFPPKKLQITKKGHWCCRV